MNGGFFFMGYLAIIVFGFCVAWWLERRRPMPSAEQLREQVANDNARRMANARVCYGAPNVDGHTGEVRAR